MSSIDYFDFDDTLAMDEFEDFDEAKYDLSHYDIQKSDKIPPESTKTPTNFHDNKKAGIPLFQMLKINPPLTESQKKHQNKTGVILNNLRIRELQDKLLLLEASFATKKRLELKCEKAEKKDEYQKTATMHALSEQAKLIKYIRELQNEAFQT